jgi:hypothetical protein
VIVQEPPSAELGLKISRYLFEGQVDRLLDALAHYIVSNRIEVSDAALGRLNQAVEKARAMRRH